MFFFEENVSIDKVDLEDVFDNLEDVVSDKLEAESAGGEE